MSDAVKRSPTIVQRRAYVTSRMLPAPAPPAPAGLAAVVMTSIARAALEARRVVRIPGALVARVLRVRAQRAAASFECTAGRLDRGRRDAALHPVDARGEH